MKQHNKVHAFTLSELSIVLLLSSVVVGLAFTVLGLVQKQMGAIQANFNQTLQVTTLETELWLNFNRYPNISYNSFYPDLLVCHYHRSISKMKF